MSRQSRTRHRGALHRSTGFTLIEVLIAMLVLMVGLLGVAAVQLVSFQNNQSAYLRTQATLVASEFMDRMRANPEGHRSGILYDSIDTGADALPGDQACLSSALGCSPGQLARQDVRDWRLAHFEGTAGARPTLPGGRATVVRSANNEFTVRVFWREKDWTIDGNSNAVRGSGLERAVELRSVLL